MRTIERTGRFKRDYKREKKGRHAKTISGDLQIALAYLIADRHLPQRFTDHPLSGNWSDHRDCHVRPDLVLIYRKVGTHTLQLVRLGSHSELGL
jgi:mRNA interferase YafQ